ISCDAAQPARGLANPGALPEMQDALRELVQVLRLRGDNAGVFRALSELGKLGQQLGSDVEVLGADVGRLETAVASADDSAQLSDHAALLFSRLPDELVARAPELARRVAAQIGSDNPLIMKRVIQLVGLGPLDTQATVGLAGVLSEWAQREPEVQPFLPKDPTDTRELTSATQYLLANR